MARQGRSNDWGFPRWRSYDATFGSPRTLRLCDHVGCLEPGTCPAPKAPNRPERWWFCETHAAEYNSRWDYFRQLGAEERAAEEARDRAERGNYRQARHWHWGEGDGSRSQAEHDALRLLELPPDASNDDIKASYRRLAKDHHPDLNRDSKEAAKRFQAIQAAYEILRKAAARRTAPDDPGSAD